MYKPLPDSVTIQQSGINGLGLFAKQPLDQATNLGITHIKIQPEVLEMEVTLVLETKCETFVATVMDPESVVSPIRRFLC